MESKLSRAQAPLLKDADSKESEVQVLYFPPDTDEEEEVDIMKYAKDYEKGY